MNIALRGTNSNGQVQIGGAGTGANRNSAGSGNDDDEGLDRTMSKRFAPNSANIIKGPGEYEGAAPGERAMQNALAVGRNPNANAGSANNNNGNATGAFVPLVNAGAGLGLNDRNNSVTPDVRAVLMTAGSQAPPPRPAAGGKNSKLFGYGMPNADADANAAQHNAHASLF